MSKPDGWHKVPHSVTERIAELGLGAFAVYCVLRRHADDKDCCWPSLARIAELTGMTPRSVRRLLRQIEDLGLIATEFRSDDKTSRTSVYRVPLPQEPPDTEDRGEDTEDRGPRTLRSVPPDPEVPRNKNKEQDQRKKSGTAAKNGYSEDFQAFWLAVAPHKRKSKQDAFRRYREAVKILADAHDDAHAFLLDRAKAYYASPLGKTQYCNGPAPWLHQGGYDDDPAAWQCSSNGDGVPAAPEPIQYRN